MKKGILGVAKDPKNKMLFSLDKCFGDDWPSSDSDDSDYEGSPATSSLESKCRKKIKAKNDAVNTVRHDAHFLSCPGTWSGDIWGNCIPHLVLLKIFHYVVESAGALPFLCRAQRVCRLWYQCASVSALWKTVDLSYGWIKANDATLRLLCNTRFTKLVNVNLSNWKLLNAEGLKLLADTCPQLKSINLSFCRVNSSGVLYMIEKCSDLAEIDLTSYGCPAVVSAKVVVQIINKCSGNLRSLNLSRNSVRGYSAVLKAIAASCPNLECLDLSQNPDSFLPLVFDVEQLQHGCPKLCILRLINTVVEPARVSLNDKNESPGFPELQELYLGITGTMKMFSGRTEILHRLTKTSKKLKLLDLRGLEELTCADLRRVPATDLADLSVAGCSVALDEAIEVIAAHWQHSLVELDISWNTSAAALDVAMNKLARNSRASKLEVLDLRGTNISLSSVKFLLQECPALRSLNLSSCRNLPRGMKQHYADELLDQFRKNIDSVRTVSDVTQ